MELGQHWFRQWLVAWRQQAITLTNVDLSGWSCGIHLNETFHSNFVIPFTKSDWNYTFKIRTTFSRVHWVNWRLVLAAKVWCLFLLSSVHIQLNWTRLFGGYFYCMMNISSILSPCIFQYEGIGIDIRKRGIWDMYGDQTKLVVCCKIRFSPFKYCIIDLWVLVMKIKIPLMLMHWS